MNLDTTLTAPSSWTDPHTPVLPRPPWAQAAMAASYRGAPDARAVQQQLLHRFALPATLWSAPSRRIDPAAPGPARDVALGLLVALGLVLAGGLLGPIALAAAGAAALGLVVCGSPRASLVALIARARRKGHVVLLVPEVPQRHHDDVAALLLSTGLSWWDGTRSAP